MPAKISTDSSIPLIARRYPLAAALLSNWEHAESCPQISRYMHADARRADAARVLHLNIPSYRA